MTELQHKLEFFFPPLIPLFYFFGNLVNLLEHGKRWADTTMRGDSASVPCRRILCGDSIYGGCGQSEADRGGAAMPLNLARRQFYRAHYDRTMARIGIMGKPAAIHGDSTDDCSIRRKSADQRSPRRRCPSSMALRPELRLRCTPCRWDVNLSRSASAVTHS